MDINIANDSNNILQKSDSYNSIKSNGCISTSGKFSMNAAGKNNFFQDIQDTNFNSLHLNSENSQNINQNDQDLNNILCSENISDKRNNCDVEDENTQLNLYSKKFLKPITDVPACDVSFNVVLPINVTYVENLSSFWLQPKKKQFEELLNHLQSAEVVKCEYTVSVGQYFLAPYVKDNLLHRVKVLKLLLENNLLVHYIDYGDKGTIPISSLQLLPPSFAIIPSQAILCFLEGIHSEGLVLDFFRDLVSTEDVFAVISPPVEEHYPVKLFIKSSNENETLFEMVDIIQYIFNHMKKSCVSKDILISDSTFENSRPIESACQDAEIDKLKECEYTMLSNNGSNDISSIENSFLKDIKYEMLEFGTNFHRNWSLRVPEPDIEYIGDNSILIMLTSITSPSEFFANIISSSSNLLDILEERMNIFYETWNMKCINEDKLIQPGIFCCCKDTDGKWYRAKLIKILEAEENNEEINVIVSYVDYGDKRKVSRKDILPLSPAFTKLPAFAVCCSLANIEPLQTGNNVAKIWPKETIERFFKLTGFEHSFIANIVSHGNAENKFPLKIILWQTKTEVKSINHILVEEGLASLAVCVGNLLKTNNVNNGLEDDKDISDNWNPMADDYLSERNSYKVDVDDPGVAVTGYKSSQEEYICRHFLRTGKCLWGNSCKYKHTRNEDHAYDVILGNENIFSCDIDLDIPENGKYVLVQITAVFNPSRFYVIFPYGPVSLHEIISQQQQQSFNLEQLVKDMSKHYTRKKTSKDLTHEALGKIVAVKSNLDGLWYRGRIRTVNETSKQVEIFFVDFGNCEWINQNNVEDIDEMFMEFPFQALECRLANININKWKEQKHLEKEAYFLFRDLAEGKVLIALILEKVDSILYLNLYTLDGIAINEEFIKNDLFDYSSELY
ncbi:tudor domain-containing protein 15-like [Centruroides vittatus]|uniref:tudor domain-containing protein 15-like n=1 Tax=Centruroides vittatus TaxID=120091 RepID=UPI00350FF285